MWIGRAWPTELHVLEKVIMLLGAPKSSGSVNGMHVAVYCRGSADGQLTYLRRSDEVGEEGDHLAERDGHGKCQNPAAKTTGHMPCVRNGKSCNSQKLHMIRAIGAGMTAGGLGTREGLALCGRWVCAA